MRPSTLVVLGIACFLAKDVVSQPVLTNTCTQWFEPKTYQDAIVATTNPAYDRPAVIFGEPQPVPAMRIRILDSNSENALENKSITVIYGWRWLEYPYPEHAWGAWNSTADRLSCALNKEGWLETPTHEVHPRGWYDGKYAHWPWPKKPSFTGIGLVAVTSKGFARFSVDPKDLGRFSDSVLVVRVFDGWRTELSWHHKP